jgi:hypothetical protein
MRANYESKIVWTCLNCIAPRPKPCAQLPSDLDTSTASPTATESRCSPHALRRVVSMSQFLPLRKTTERQCGWLSTSKKNGKYIGWYGVDIVMTHHNHQNCTSQSHKAQPKCHPTQHLAQIHGEEAETAVKLNRTYRNYPNDRFATLEAPLLDSFEAGTSMCSNIVLPTDSIDCDVAYGATSTTW